MDAQIVSYPTASRFLEACEPFLSSEAATNSLMLGIANAATDPKAPACPLLFSVQVDGEIAACGMQSDPQKPVILAFSSEPISPSVEQAILKATPVQVEAFVGASPNVDSVIDAWCKRHNRPVKTRIAQGIFELIQLNQAGFQDIGTLKLATQEHFALICEWILAFEHDVFPHETFAEEDARHFTETAVQSRSLFILVVDNIPRTMAAIARPTKIGASISYVYTPPEHRKHGYASTAVAKLAQYIQSAGKKRVWLYTDLANPTSNKIYQNIGFERRADSLYVAF